MLDTRYNTYPENLLVPLCPMPPRAPVASDAETDRLSELVAARMGVTSGQVLLTDSGLTALYLALIGSVGPGGAVALSTYNCPAVVKAVRLAGCCPVFVDVAPKRTVPDPQTFAAALAEGADAVIAAHVLGQKIEMAELAHARATPSGTIINDLSQVFPLVGHDELLGYGALSVLSFGRHKPVNAGGGGALVVHDLARLDRMRALWTGLPAQSTNTLPPLTGRFVDVRDACAAVLHRGKQFHRIGPGVAAVAADLLDRWPATGARGIDYGEQLTEVICEHASDLMAPLPYDIPLPRIWLPVELHRPEARHAIARLLATQGVETTWQYFPLHLLTETAVCFPQAERMAGASLCLPCRGELSAVQFRHLRTSLSQVSYLRRRSLKDRP